MRQERSTHTPALEVIVILGVLDEVDVVEVFGGHHGIGEGRGAATEASGDFLDRVGKAIDATADLRVFRIMWNREWERE